jgi:hypothetical protein
MNRSTKSDYTNNTVSARSAAAQSFVLITLIGLSTTLGGCLAAAAAGAGAGVGYAVGHESGEDHVSEGKHADDD